MRSVKALALIGIIFGALYWWTRSSTPAPEESAHHRRATPVATHASIPVPAVTSAPPHIPAAAPDTLANGPFNPWEWPEVDQASLESTAVPTLSAVELAQLYNLTITPAPRSDSNDTNPVHSEHPMIQTLKEIERGANESSRINPGYRTGASVSDGTIDTSAPQPTPLANATPVFNRVSGQTRGYHMLYLMHPRARQTVEKQIEIMLRSEVNELYLGVLTDGTFGKDFEYLKQVITRLSSGGRVLTLALYLTNGSTMRTYSAAAIDAGFNSIAPEDFRELIKYDNQVRARFITMVREVKPIFAHNRDANPFNRNIAVVMLEDNLDQQSYRVMRALAQPELGDLVQFVRNPCLGCVDGNDNDSLGDGREEHIPEALKTLGKRDGFSLDGVGYRFAGEPQSRQLSIDDVKALIEESFRRQVSYFALWRAERQGRAGNRILLPDERTYEIPTEEQAEVEIELLRHGLGAIENN